MAFESKQSFLRSFIVAFEGIWVGLTKGRNFRIQVILGILAIIAGFIFQLSIIEWVLLLLTINFVLMLELINTSIEAVVDLVSPEIRDKAKVAKDTAVAAVLISSIFSFFIGAVLFLPKLLQMLKLM
jgi:undecaprenol kinase